MHGASITDCNRQRCRTSAGSAPSGRTNEAPSRCRSARAPAPFPSASTGCAGTAPATVDESFPERFDAHFAVGFTPPMACSVSLRILSRGLAGRGQGTCAASLGERPRIAASSPMSMTGRATNIILYVPTSWIWSCIPTPHPSSSSSSSSSSLPSRELNDPGRPSSVPLATASAERRPAGLRSASVLHYVFPASAAVLHYVFPPSAAVLHYVFPASVRKMHVFFGIGNPSSSGS